MFTRTAVLAALENAGERAAHKGRDCPFPPGAEQMAWQIGQARYEHRYRYRQDEHKRACRRLNRGQRWTLIIDGVPVLRVLGRASELINIWDEYEVLLRPMLTKDEGLYECEAAAACALLPVVCMTRWLIDEHRKS